MDELPPNLSGTYVLILHVSRRRKIKIGRRGFCMFDAGYYGYTGSAFGPGGLRARVRHHLKISKRPHWHIDYLRRRSTLVAVWWSASQIHKEHDWAAILSRSRRGRADLKGFGASDCKCTTHLFYFDKRPGITAFRSELKASGLKDRIHCIDRIRP